jgi:hypothetical protein
MALSQVVTGFATFHLGRVDAETLVAGSGVEPRGD